MRCILAIGSQSAGANCLETLARSLAQTEQPSHKLNTCRRQDERCSAAFRLRIVLTLRYSAWEDLGRRMLTLSHANASRNAGWTATPATA